jgi:hypothetical protein
MTFFNSHSGKGVLGVCLAALLLAWPPACSWITAGLLLGWAASHLNSAFEGLSDEEAAQLGYPVAEVPQQLAGDAGGIPVAVGSLLVGADARRSLPGGGGDTSTEIRVDTCTQTATSSTTLWKAS